MVSLGKWIAKHKYLILLIGFLLLIPSFYGMIKTRTNYDILSYLPDTLETVKGQDIMVDEVRYGGFLDGCCGRHGAQGCTEAGRSVQ